MTGGRHTAGGGRMEGPDVRTDALTGATVVVTSTRQDRPNLPEGGCPFCPGGVEAPEPYEVRWFPNRWPSLAGGRCEVLLYAPDHEASLPSLGVAGVERVVRLWAQRTAVLGARDDVAYVLPFENRGPEVGATIAHPHGQLYAFDHVPAAVALELEAAAAAGRCALCGDPAGDRVVSRAGTWTAWVPDAAQWPYELRLATTAHVGSLTDEGADHHGLAATLVDALSRLDGLFGEPMPYMLWLHQRPTDGLAWPQAHVHVHIAPLYRGPRLPRYVAAGELGSGEFFNPILPEEAAARLRSA